MVLFGLLPLRITNSQSLKVSQKAHQINTIQRLTSGMQTSCGAVGRLISFLITWHSENQ
jgi:hypothetical protein